MAKRISETERLLHQSTELLTRQMEVVEELRSRGADTTDATRLLKEMARAFEKWVERTAHLLRQHWKMLVAPFAREDRLP